MSPHVIGRDGRRVTDRIRLRVPERLLDLGWWIDTIPVTTSALVVVMVGYNMPKTVQILSLIGVVFSTWGSGKRTGENGHGNGRPSSGSVPKVAPPSPTNGRPIENAPTERIEHGTN